MASDSPLVDFNAVCQKLRAAVEPARTHAISLHDDRGEMLWLTESSMGPDEHNAVLEAVEAFADPRTAPALAVDLGDSRSAVMLRAVGNRQTVVGVVMIIMDSRVVAQGLPKLMTPKLQRALAQFAAMRADPAPAPAPTPAPTPAAPAKSSPAPQAASGNRSSVTAPAANPRAAAAPAAQRGAPKSKPSAPPAAPAAAAPAAASPALSTHASMPFSSAHRSISAQVQQIVPPRAAPQAQSRPTPQAQPSPRPASAARAPATPASGPLHAPPVTPAAHAIPTVHSTPGSPPTSSALASVRADLGSNGSGAGAGKPAIPRSARPPQLTPLALEESGRHSLRSGVTPEIDRLHAALRKSPIALHVQRLMPLSKGSQLKRYEVLLRSGSEEAPNAAPHAMLKTAVENGLGSMIDRRVLSELISWLIRHPESCQADENMFSVNLTSTALRDEHFIKFVELCLAKSSLPKATIAFEIDASTALSLASQFSDVAAALHALGCPLILDDFALRTECFELLRLPGVRYVKLSPEMTARMRTDKLCQAAITGVVQMARVLGMHTVAKRTDSAADQEWLTALGVDFVQSNSMSPPVAIDSLLRPAALRF